MSNYTNQDMSKGLLVEAENFFDQFVRNVDKWNLIPEKSHVLLYFSGGKDSNVLLDLFMRYRNEVRDNFTLEVATVAFPRMVYLSKDAKQQEAWNITVDFWKKRGIEIDLHIPDDYYTDDKLEEGTYPPCYTCEMLKTRILSKRYEDKGYKGALVAISHSTWDVMGYVDELVQMVGRHKTWQNIPKGSADAERFLHLAKRCYPKLPFEKLTYIRPLLNFVSPDFVTYNDSRKIPILPECCADFADGWYMPYKRGIMQSLTIRDWVAPRRDPVSGTVRFDLDYEQIMEFAKRNNAMPEIEDLQRLISPEKLGI